MDLSLIKKFLADLLEKMQIEFSQISVEEESGVIYANIETPHAALLIGKNGQNLDALQHLLKVIIFRAGGEKVFLLVDVENFRRKKNDEVLKTAREQAEAVRETGV
jgi:spoIIIJ-associated protein